MTKPPILPVHIHESFISGTACPLPTYIGSPLDVRLRRAMHCYDVDPLPPANIESPPEFQRVDSFWLLSNHTTSENGSHIPVSPPRLVAARRTFVCDGRVQDDGNVVHTLLCIVDCLAVFTLGGVLLHGEAIRSSASVSSAWTGRVRVRLPTLIHRICICLAAICRSGRCTEIVLHSSHVAAPTVKREKVGDLIFPLVPYDHTLILLSSSSKT